jgi:two-component system repressor protein LuxO
MPPPASSRPSSVAAIRPLIDVERDAIEQAITLCDGNIQRAAAALGVSPSTLYRKRQGWETPIAS